MQIHRAAGLKYLLAEQRGKKHFEVFVLLSMENPYLKEPISQNIAFLKTSSHLTNQLQISIRVFLPRVEIIPV